MAAIASTSCPDVLCEDGIAFHAAAAQALAPSDKTVRAVHFGHENLDRRKVALRGPLRLAQDRAQRMQDDPLDQDRRALLPEVSGQLIPPVQKLSHNLSDKFLSCKQTASGPR